MGKAQRIDERYQIELSVDLVVGKRRTTLASEDVSFSGMFLKTASPPPMRGLVRLDVPLADEARTLTLHAMVVHVIKPDNAWGRTPGIGLRFYGIDRADRDAWIRFVNRSKAGSASRRAGGITANIAVIDNDEAAPTVPARYAAVLEVHPSTTTELETFMARDVSRGGTFLRTDLELNEGQELFVELVHPDTHELFGIKSRVLRQVSERGTSGVEVAFLELDEAKRGQLWNFVNTALPLDDDDILIVEDTDLWNELSPETLRASAAVEATYHRPGGL